MARAKADGHRVVLVVATRGELGELRARHRRAGRDRWPTGASPSSSRPPRSSASTGSSSSATVDSGMAGEPTNDAPTARSRAPTSRKRRSDWRSILREEDADVLTVYDDHGGYGHPDHVQVHRVGVRAAELAGTPRVYESTMNRDYIRRSDARRPPTRCPTSPNAARRRRDGRLRLAEAGSSPRPSTCATTSSCKRARDGRPREPDPGPTRSS